MIAYDEEKVPCETMGMELERHLDVITAVVSVIDRKRIEIEARTGTIPGLVHRAVKETLATPEIYKLITDSILRQAVPRCMEVFHKVMEYIRPTEDKDLSPVAAALLRARDEANLMGKEEKKEEVHEQGPSKVEVRRVEEMQMATAAKKRKPVHTVQWMKYAPVPIPLRRNIKMTRGRNLELEEITFPQGEGQQKKAGGLQEMITDYGERFAVP